MNETDKKITQCTFLGGKVKLETIPEQNFFWTPLGKSYSCWEAEDQGPLKLFNVAADEVSEDLQAGCRVREYT